LQKSLKAKSLYYHVDNEINFANTREFYGNKYAIEIENDRKKF